MSPRFSSLATPTPRAARTGEGSATGVPAGGGGGGSGPGATLIYSTVEPTFSTIYKRPVERVGPQTNKHSPSSRRAQGDAHGRAGQSDIMLRAADFVVPFGGTHALVVPVV